MDIFQIINQNQVAKRFTEAICEQIYLYPIIFDKKWKIFFDPLKGMVLYTVIPVGEWTIQIEWIDPGNVFVRKTPENFELILLDNGLYRSYSASFR